MHESIIRYKDAQGNSLEKKIAIDILGTLQNIEIILPSEIKETNNIKIYINTTDQDNETINTSNFNIIIYDKEGDKIYSEEWETNKGVIEKLKPGIYTIIVEKNSLNSQKMFEVEATANIEFNYDGGLIIKNTGNAPYNDYVNIQIMGSQDKEISEKLNLKPGEEKTLPLELSENDKLHVTGKDFSYFLNKDDLNKITGMTIFPFNNGFANFFLYLIVIIIGFGIYYWRKK